MWRVAYDPKITENGVFLEETLRLAGRVMTIRAAG
jgi:hypothetical protein